MEFYRDKISYGKIPHGKISVKILRRNFRAPYSKNRRKIGVKSRQDRRSRRKEREFFAKFTTKFRRQKPVQSSPKECKKTKKPPQNPRDKIALDMAGFELAANFPG
jgi:hypothetical protein